MGDQANASRKRDEFVVFLARPENALKPKLDILMTALTAAPLAPLLDRLFADAEAAEPDIDAAFADLSDDEQARMLRSKTDYRELYGRLKNLPLPVSRETGALLYILARSAGARTIVEFGTSFGISTLHLAAALRDNGGGRLITSEFEPSKAARARDNLKAGGVIDLVEIREGDALETLSVDLPDTIDLVLLDGAKSLYPEILSLLEGRLRQGALVVADNADMSPDYLKRVRAPANGYMSVPFAEDVELSMRL
jgi:predicted O-methyltransferase YrrM